MTLKTRVVVYAEGERELSGELVLSRAPRAPLAEVDLGAAHILVRRALGSLAPSLESGVEFEEPLMLVPGPRRPRGSDFLKRRNLRRLLTWPLNPPDLAVVLVDEDGDKGRFTWIRSFLEDDWSPPFVLGVAVREFEGWLIGDIQAVRDVLGVTIDEQPERERMEPGRAKALLDSWTSGKRVERLRIARQLQIDILERGSTSFRRFMDQLREYLLRIRQ